MAAQVLPVIFLAREVESLVKRFDTVGDDGLAESKPGIVRMTLPPLRGQSCRCPGRLSRGPIRSTRGCAGRVPIRRRLRSRTVRPPFVATATRVCRLGLPILVAFFEIDASAIVAQAGDARRGASRAVRAVPHPETRFADVADGQDPAVQAKGRLDDRRQPGRRAGMCPGLPRSTRFLREDLRGRSPTRRLGEPIVGAT